MYQAIRFAIMRAENGWPIIPSQANTFLGTISSPTSGLFKNVFRTIKTIGIAIMLIIIPTGGNGFISSELICNSGALT